MKTAREIFTEFVGDYHYWGGSYQPMLDEFGEIVLQEESTGYQGSSWVLYKSEGKYGYLEFGWGSCSGCDSLQACNTIDEVQELMNELCESIIWFDDAQKALTFFLEHDWEGDWSSSEIERKEFTRKGIEYLMEAK